MKRKWFTLLFALLAVASFRVAAQPPVVSPVCPDASNYWWVKVDITGLALSGANQLPYSGNKLTQPNWLIWDTSKAPDSTRINFDKSLIGEGDKALYSITQVNDRMFNFIPKLNSPTPLQLTYDGNNWTQFEVVQFDSIDATSGAPVPNLGGWGFTRTTQALTADGIEGYLMPAQGGQAGTGVLQQDSTASMLMVVADANHSLSIKRWDEVFTYSAAVPAPATIQVDSFTVFNFKNMVGNIQFDALQSGSVAGYPTNYFAQWTGLDATSLNIPNATATDMYFAAIQGAGLSIQEQVMNTGDSYTDAGSLVNTAINGNGAVKVVYAAKAIDTSNPDWMKDPTNFTEYIGTPFSSDMTDWAANIAVATNWTNGLPYSVVATGAEGPNITAGATYYFIFVKAGTGVMPNPNAGTATTAESFGYTANAIKYGWQPVYIKLERPAGRWATADDFGPGYYQFNGLSVSTAADVQARKSGAATYDTFAVTQVDWVAQGTISNSGSNQSEGNIFGNPGETDATSGAAYYTPKFDPTVGGNDTTGLQMGGTVLNGATDNIIPLFTLSSPENGCDVVSVSRENDLTVQSQAPGVYANKLELRAYGDYYDYWAAKGAWEVHHAKSTNLWDAQNAIANEAGQPVLQEDRVATSLQKFAIWIDVCGNMTLYPAAAYSWIYGEGKPTQISTVSPNSVLLYNNINIAAAPGVAADADKGWGTQVGWWNGRNTNDTNDAWQVTTAPNKLTTTTDYQPLQFNPAPNNPNGQDIAGKFYFLEVQGVQTPTVTATGEGSYFAKNAIQDATQTQYVLSTEVVYDPTTGAGTKKLVMVPMEKVRRYADNTNGNKWYNDLLAYKAIEQADANGIVPAKAILPDYWSNNPYDSVNMAAHWEINKVAGGYQLVNMLGDVLQYNLDGTSNLAGGYLPVSSNISGNVSGTPLFNESGQWFAPNSVAAAAGTTQSVWTASALPGAAAGDESFVMSLGDYTLNLSGWYSGTTKAWGDSTYYQQDVVLQKPATPALPLQIGDVTCPNSLLLKTVPIYYVPNYSGSFNLEDQTLGNTAATINTSDPSYKDGQMVQDSLTAYLYLNGTYGIKEATAVNNDLLLGDTITDYLTTAGTARAAALDANGSQNLQFIPLAQSGRSAAIQKAVGANTPDGLGVDTLYGESYKWFVVMKGNQYLVFDTINPNAQDERLKVAFTFQTTGVENATPVRLYQPLVGDKLQGNFIFQFQIPYNTYDAKNAKYYVNVWPAIPGVDANTTITNGTRVFGQLSNQSNYIQANADKAQATRFTYTFMKSTPAACCAQQFIDPDWMASQKLLGLPLQNQIWGLTASDSLGLGFYTGATTTPVLDKSRTEATVNTGITDLTFTYVDSIQVASNGANGVYTYTIGDNQYSVNTFATQDLRKDGQSVVAVPLYYIQNDKGQYLTVSDTTYMFDPQSTATDVTGVNLIWASKYSPNADPTKNMAALQLFAISGNETNSASDLVNGWYTACQSYVYLPLASYKATYSKGTVDNSVIYYNNGLGISGTSTCDFTNAPVNDVTQAFRVGYYSKLGVKDQQNLAVLNASGAELTSAVPVVSKWQKNPFDGLHCGDVLVENTTNGAFYTSDGTICQADSNTIIAHWEAKSSDGQLYTFAPEQLIPTFDYTSAQLTGNRSQLMGSYYFKMTAQSGDTTTVTAYDFTNYNGLGTNKYKIGTSTYNIICVNHTSPYYNLEPEYELPAQLAILESAYADRGLSDRSIDPKYLYGPTAAQVVGKDTVAWITYLDQNEGDITKATYLTAYKTNVRRLAADINADGTGHDIPYFAFSLTKKDNSTGKNMEYFLNVVPKEVTGVKDSLYWSADVDGSVKAQIQNDWANGAINEGSKALSRYKFCLPYQVYPYGKIIDGKDVSGQRVAAVPYGSTTYQPVYIQSMDTALNDAPYLVIVGAGSQLATVVRVSDDVFSLPGVCGATTGSLSKNIYSMDYAQVDPYQVTSWIFGGQMPSSTEWVPLANTEGQSPYLNPDLGTTELSTDGMLTKYQLDPAGQGITFITNSQQQPVQYGLLSGQSNGSLHFVYEGTEQIGTYAKVPIYYYRIQSPDASGMYLTDSYNLAKTDDSYVYPWSGGSYNYAYFDATKLPATITGKPYDGTFTQTLGLRYVSVDNNDSITVADGSVAAQTFVVVSNANYSNNTQQGDYRYLAAANGRLTFVNGIGNAMAFQFGRENADNGFTGVQVVGSGEVFGVTGGVRLLNQAGSVANLYSVDGSLLKTVQVTGADQTVDAPRGIVIVKVADKATKVIVK